MNFRLIDLQPVDWSRSQGDLEEEEIKKEYDIIYLGSKISKRILLFGTNKGSIFLFSQFPDKKLIGSFIFPELKINGKLNLDKENINDPITYVYEYKEFIIILNQQKIDRCYDFIESLKKNISFDILYIFDSILESEYKNLIPNTPLILSTKETFIFPYLESPSIIQGISASLMEYSTIFKKNATLFISFDNQDVFKSFELIFKILNYPITSNYQSSFKINHSIYI